MDVDNNIGKRDHHAGLREPVSSVDHGKGDKEASVPL